MNKLSVRLLGAASVVALASTAFAQENNSSTGVETVVVTGSRVISDAANSPTPLTVVSTQQLLSTTPTDIPDALNKLPIFVGSSGPSAPRDAKGNQSGNVLNLRNFGAQRTLVLFDGHRVAPSNANGTVDVDVLPQMLMSRVDVVTGGASAVYGSDAVTGVVNFVLDKHFNGVKYDVNSGISNYADGAEYQAGLAAGLDLFGGRGHLEGSLRYHHSDLIHLDQRPYGRTGYLLTGSGSKTNPFVNSADTRYGAFAWGGLISCAGTAANPCAANGQQFVSNGIIGPFDPGTPTGTAGTPQGGDAPWTPNSTLAALQDTADAFERFSYNLDDTTVFYVQGTQAQSYNWSTWTANYLQVAASAPHTFYKNNPFLTPDAKALLAGGTGNTFGVTEYIRDQGRSGQTARGLDTNLGITTGLDGLLMGKYDWDIYYTHNDSRLKEDDPHNQNNAKMTAALDAVTDSSGHPVCYVSTTSYASLYPGCIPMNPFGPTALTTEQYNYWVNDSYFINSFSMDDLGGSISGTIFDLPAGPLKAALSGEFRTLGFGVQSNALPGAIDCTGLRLCNNQTPLWQGGIVAAAPTTSENVWEFGAEAEIPVVKDLPLVQSFSVNLAGRYTDYSVSGAVQTWKVGLDYHVNDDLRFRGTTSVDIRAPTLNDLFSPVQTGPSGYVDLHTGNITFPVLPSQSQGNPNLVPEVARTYTAGVVLTPTFLPGFTSSIDYYRIALKNAIGNISGGSNSIQTLCENSGGTSPYCALYIRPYPFSDHTPDNVPSLVLSELLNTALNQTEGWDYEANYAFEAADVIGGMPGSFNLRWLANDQPYNVTVAYANAPHTYDAIPKFRMTTFVDYSVGSWGFHVQDRWYSGYNRSAQPGVIFYVQPRAKALNYVDLTIDKQFMVEDAPVTAYLSIQDVINTPPPIAPNVQNGPNLYPNGSTTTADGVDVIGRYFTVGVRGSF